MILFTSAHRQLEKLINHYPNSTVYNVGNGAKLEGAVAAAADDLFPICSSLDKTKQIEAIKDTFVSLPSEEINDELIALSRYREMCDHLISIASEAVKTREEAARLLMRQSRYLYAFRNSPLGHLFYMLKGSMLYYFCPMVTLLYTYECEDETLVYFDKLNSLWIGYVSEMKEEYVLNHREKCDLGKG